MNRPELVSKIVKETGQTKKSVDEIIIVAFSIMRETLKEGEDIRFNNFGSLKKGYRKERKGTNPQTSKPIVIPGKDTVKFVPCKDFF